VIALLTLLAVQPARADGFVGIQNLGSGKCLEVEPSNPTAPGALIPRNPAIPCRMKPRNAALVAELNGDVVT
jgi:hypothetical protein